MKLPVYFDNQATTPIDPRVLDAMMPFLTSDFGNAASSEHILGDRASQAVEKARAEIAALISAEPKEIIFTSGATESINLALKGAMQAYALRGNHLVTAVTEHRAVLDTCAYLEKQGKEISYVSVDSGGRVNIEDIRKELTEATVLISVMHANNEIGTIQPVPEIGKLAKENNILFHVDAAQSAGKIPVDVHQLNADLLSFSSHKMYGPKGAGALYVRRKDPHTKISPLIHGGGHENGFRSGTLNVPAIVGFGKACEIARQEMEKDRERVGKLRDRLITGLTKELDDVSVNGDLKSRLYNNLNVSFEGVETAGLLMSLRTKVCLSSGSACSSGRAEASYVLKALGLEGRQLHSAIRFGLGRFTTEEEVDYAVQTVAESVNRLRALSPMYDQKAKKKK